MYLINIVVILISLTIFYEFVQCEEMYTTKWDNTDIDAILRSDRLLNSYVKCVMDEGNCTPDGAELKRVLAEALATDCAKCSAKQKEGAKKVILYLIKNKPEIWARIESKYDPEAIYRTKYAAKYGLTKKP